MGYRSYSKELKKQIVHEINTSGRKIQDISNSHGIKSGVVHGWLLKQEFNPDGYQDRIKKSLNNKRTKRTRPQADSLPPEDVDLLSDMTTSQQQITRLPARIHDEQEFDALKLQIRKLEKENLFLKKTTAYFAAQFASEDA